MSFADTTPAILRSVEWIIPTNVSGDVGVDPAHTVALAEERLTLYGRQIVNREITLTVEAMTFGKKPVCAWHLLVERGDAGAPAVDEHEATRLLGRNDYFDVFETLEALRVDGLIESLHQGDQRTYYFDPEV